jgi:TraX protein
MHVLVESRVTRSQVDNTDLLKAAAILLVAIDHFAIYFVVTQPLQDWLQVLGRLAAPVFFFLIGFATNRTVPISWLVLGCILMVFDAWGDNWNWGAGSILFSFALFRFMRPYIRKIVRESWIGTIFLIASLIAASAISEISQYVEPLALDGAPGWLWALLGLCQREYVDSQDSTKWYFALFRWLILPITVSVFWLRTAEHYTEFTTIQMGALAISFAILALVLVRFKRGPSRWQPRSMAALALRFVGHNTLEIYAAQLIISPIILKIWPQLVY